MSSSSHSALQPGLFKNQVIIVTGGGRGIGRSIALLLASLGGKVVIAELSAEGHQVAHEIRTQGGEALYVQTDVSLETHAARLAKQTRETFGEPDILINNAIYSPVALVTQMPAGMWDRVMAVNLRGTFLTCRAFVPQMISRKQGRIINMVSTEAMPGMSAYIASKQGITGFTQSLHAEVVRHGVRVAAFAPGMVDTPAIREIAPELSGLLEIEEEQFLSLSLHPAYPGLMPPEDAAVATALLAACYMDEYNGEIVDGYAILERSGWIKPAGLDAGEGEVIPPLINSAAAGQAAREAAASLNRKLFEILASTAEELNLLPVFARPMARSGFKRKAGMRLQDWLREAGDLSVLLEAEEPLSSEAIIRIAAYLQKFGKLAEYYRGVPGETARFTRDKAFLGEVEAKTRDRLNVIRTLERELQRFNGI